MHLDIPEFIGSLEVQRGRLFGRDMVQLIRPEVQKRAMIMYFVIHYLRCRNYRQNEELMEVLARDAINMSTRSSRVKEKPTENLL